MTTSSPSRTPDPDDPYEGDWDLLTHCECGVALDVHPPLEPPKPRVQRNIDPRLSRHASIGAEERKLRVVP